MTLEEHCRDYEERFPEHFERLTGEWAADGEDAFWLIRHASYLFRTSNVRWGVDLTLRTEEMLNYTEDRAAAFAPMRFVLLTHFHSDHFNKRLCAQMKGDEAVWVVPDFVPEDIKRVIVDAHAHVRFVKSGDVFALENHTITVLPGHHFDDGHGAGIAAYTYAVETPESKKLYLPSDVRDFRTLKTVDYPNADYLFAHVWLGRCMALLPPEQTFLEPYAEYLAGSGAKHITLGHLNNYTRDPVDMWNEQHGLAVQKRLSELKPEIITSIPRLGVKHPLC